MVTDSTVADGVHGFLYSSVSVIHHNRTDCGIHTETDQISLRRQPLDGKV